MGHRATGRLLAGVCLAIMCICAAQAQATPVPKGRPYVVAPFAAPLFKRPLVKPKNVLYLRPPQKPLSLIPPSLGGVKGPALTSDVAMCTMGAWQVKMEASVDGPGGCGIKKPVSLSAMVSEGRQVGFTLPVQIECSLAQELERWMRDVAQPAAQREFGLSIVKLQTAAGYACRGRNNKKGAKLSEHGKGNAIDVAAFHLSDGREITVEDGWDGSSSEVRFLSSLHKGACERFTTVLGPNADRYHQDHLHFDQGCHGKTCAYRVCK